MTDDGTERFYRSSISGRSEYDEPARYDLLAEPTYGVEGCSNAGDAVDGEGGECSHDKESDESPAPKRRRVENERGERKVKCVNVRALLGEEVLRVEQRLLRVLILRVRDRKLVSAVLEKLQPLPDSLLHLKRVNKGAEVVICPSEGDDELPNLEEYGSIHEVSVPSRKPVTRAQFEWAKQHWPVYFHPNKELEDLLNITEAVRSTVRDNVDILKSPSAACVLVRNGNVIAKGIQGVDLLAHAAMQAIRSLAAEMKGKRMEKEREDTRKRTEGECEKKRSEDEDAQPGPSTTEPTTDATDSAEDEVEDEKEEKEEEYLATGADAFLPFEPCAMCAMALVHARVKRVFFARRSTNGVLMGGANTLGESSLHRWQLHLDPAINHHYTAFHVHLQYEGEEEEDQEIHACGERREEEEDENGESEHHVALHHNEDSEGDVVDGARGILYGDAPE